MQDIESISDRGARVLCHIVRGSAAPAETTFVTPPEANLQLGFIVREAGNDVPRHVHRDVERRTTGTAEAVIVRRGRCLLDVYDETRNLVATRELGVGDLVLSLAGGHGFRMPEDALLLEIKQGPYSAVNDKERF